MHFLLSLFAFFMMAVSPAAPALAESAAYNGNQISGPFTYKNMTVFFVRGESKFDGRNILTLGEAIAQKKLRVHETGTVSELAVENVSDQPVFIQAGDIVKGGKQDRVVRNDLVIKPHSGRFPIAAFCVEQGRWSKRGNESLAYFSGSSKLLSSKKLKLATRMAASQGEVWAEVKNYQKKLASRLSPASTAGGQVAAARPASPRANVTAQQRTSDYAVQQLLMDPPRIGDDRSRTSLQLTLENKELAKKKQGYIEAMSKALEDRKDVIGFAFAVNGKLNSSDIYGSSHLFAKLWPKLIEAAASEAVSEGGQVGNKTKVSTGDLIAWYQTMEKAKDERRKITDNVLLSVRKTDREVSLKSYYNNMMMRSAFIAY